MAVQQGSWERWVLDNEGLVKRLVQLVAIPLMLLVILVMVWMVLTPSVWTMTTTHPLAYLPAKYELVEDVTNIFSKPEGFAGGAGGVGAPQVEMTREMYQKNERDILHYLSLSHLDTSTALNYWDLEPGKAIHASITFSAPRFGLDSYSSRSGKIEGNNLILERRWDPNNTGKIMFFFVIFALAAWVFFGMGAGIVLENLMTWIRWKRSR